MGLPPEAGLDPFPRDDPAQKRDPLIAIGFIVMALMVVPVLLYSMVPAGPIKQDDVVFATGRYRVSFADPAPYRALGYDGYCVVEAREQLVVVLKGPASAGSSLVARPITTAQRGVPFCPPKADVVLRAHQASLRIDLWGAFRDTVGRLFTAQ